MSASPWSYWVWSDLNHCVDPLLNNYQIYVFSIDENNYSILYILHPTLQSGHEVHQRSFSRLGSVYSQELDSQVASWEQSSRKEGWSWQLPLWRRIRRALNVDGFFSPPISSYKAGFLLRLFWGTLSSSWGLSGGQSSPVSLLLWDHGRKGAATSPFFCWIMFGLFHVLDIPDHLELGSCCTRLSLAVDS